MPDYDVDITNCDVEPIHLIGEIQSYGALVAADVNDLVIRHIANTEDVLGLAGAALIGTKVTDLLAIEHHSVLEIVRNEKVAENVPRRYIELSDPDRYARPCECLIHRNAGYFILEFFPAQPPLVAPGDADRIRQHLVQQLARPADIEEIANLGTQLCRLITGYDRVMVYRFHEDRHGEVIAEETTRDDSFLGLHYPASDIPEPARRHFTLNPIRIIADVETEPVPLQPQRRPETGEPLDLTYAKLRAVSPLHIQYLKNMGVRASIAISIVANGSLWGLIACHHYSPRRLSAADIQLCKLLGSLMGTFIQGVENTEELLASKRAEDFARELEIRARGQPNVAALVATEAPHLMELVEAQGIVLCCDGKSVSFGSVPDPLPPLGELHKRAKQDIVITAKLGNLIDLTDQQKESCAGGALITLSDDGSEYIFFSRKEFAHTVNWAGNPDKGITTTSSDHPSLTPRKSFALWQSNVRGLSKPFSGSTREVVLILRRALFALRSQERERIALIAKAKADMQRASLQVQLLDAARRNSLGELASVMAHELNQPLAALMNYINACRQVLSSAEQDLPEDVIEMMDEAVSEANRAGGLVRRLRRFIEQGDLEPSPLDINVIVTNAARLGLSASAAAGVHLTTELSEDLPTIWADRMQIEQVVFNLVRNAVEAMEAVDTKAITLSTAQIGDRVEIRIADTGPGIPSDMLPDMFEPFRSTKLSGMGIGLSLCRSIVRAHGGEIFARSGEQGAEIVFLLPIKNLDDVDE